MQEIGKFFNKFNNSALKELNKREVICEILHKITQQKIEIGDISIRNATIFIKSNHGLKSEIFLKKKALLDAISNKIKDKIIDIK